MSRILNNLLVVGTGFGQAMGITGGHLSLNNSLLLGYDASGYSIYQYATASKNFLGGKLFLGLTADDGLTMLQSSITTFGTTSQITALNIVSSADSTYIQGSGTTSYTWTPSNNGKISWTNRFYNKNELASIAVVGDRTTYTSFGTTSSYSYNTGNLVFSIGTSASVATEKLRIMNDSIAIPANTSLKIGIAANSTPLSGLAPLTVLYQSGYSAFGAIYITTNISSSSPINNSVITIEGSTLNSGTTNGFSIGGVASSSNRGIPSAWIGSIQPGRGAAGSNVYTNGGQFGITSRRSGYATSSVTFNPNASAESNTKWEDYAYVATNYLSGTNLTSNLILGFNNYYSTITDGLSFATNSVTTNNISLADFRSSGFDISGINNQGQFNTTLTRYGLLIDFLSISGTISTILDANRTGIGTYSLVGWGVYQSDKNTKNFFAGQILVGTNSSDGSLLRVSGSASISGNLSLASTITDKAGLTGPSGYILSASGSGVYWIPNTGSGGSTNSFVQNGNSFGATATLGTSDNYALQFEANNNVAMIISPSGRVLIGTNSSDGSLLQIAGSASANSLRIVAGTLTIGSQVFYTQGNRGFSVNENFDVTGGTANAQTGYHFTSGSSGQSSVVFSLARTTEFTNMFGVYGVSSLNYFIIGAQDNNTKFQFKTSLGVRPVGLSGGNLLLDIDGVNNQIYSYLPLGLTGTGGAIYTAGTSSSYKHVVRNTNTGFLETTPISLYTITYSANIAYNGINSKLQGVTLTGGATLSLSNLMPGELYTFIVTQDSIGARTLSWPSGVKVAYGGSGLVPISTAGNAIDKYTILYDGSRYFIDYSLSYS
jgi:hypothetical protein